MESKFFIHEIPAEQLEVVITDWEVPKSEVENLRQKGIKVIIVEKSY